MNALIKTTEILPLVKQMLRLSNADSDIFIEELINSGARRLNTTETVVIKNCTEKVVNNRFYLPQDCKRLVAFRGKDSCIPGVFIDVPFFKRCGCATTSNFNSLLNVIDVNGRWANLINKLQDDTELEIAYQVVNTDEDGMTVINEEAYLALVNYACYNFALAYVENYTPEQRRAWKLDYEVQANMVRGKAARRTFEQQKEQIQNLMTQMVNSSAPFSALFGQYNSFFYPTITSI